MKRFLVAAFALLVAVGCTSPPNDIVLSENVTAGSDDVAIERGLVLSEQVRPDARVGDNASPEDVAREAVADALGVDGQHLSFLHGSVSAVVNRSDGTVENYDLGDYGWNVVTTVGKEFIVDSFQNSVELELMNYIGIGTSSTAEGAGDTALGTEVESRCTGTQTENGATTYRTSCTITAASARALVEAGLFSASTSGVMFARKTFSVINLATSDSITITWDITIS